MKKREMEKEMEKEKQNEKKKIQKPLNQIEQTKILKDKISRNKQNKFFMLLSLFF